MARRPRASSGCAVLYFGPPTSRIAAAAINDSTGRRISRLYDMKTNRVSGNVLCWMRRGSVFPVLCLLLCMVGGLIREAHGQSRQDQRGEYDQWLEQQQDQFAEFRSEQDAAFAKYLKETWSREAVDAPLEEPLGDKPTTIPEAENGASPTGLPAAVGRSVENQFPEERSTTRAQSAPRRSRSNTAEFVAYPSGEPVRRASLSFYGVRKRIPYVPSTAPEISGRLSPETIQAFWGEFATGAIEPLLQRTEADRERLQLNDWGYYQYLAALSRSIYGAGEVSRNDATLWVWAMLVESGYDARVGYAEDRVVLMLPSPDRVYDVPQLRLDGTRYYLIRETTRGSVPALRTYDRQHAEATDPLRLALPVMPLVEGDQETRTISFTYDGKSHSIQLQYNTAVLDYLDSYPEADLPLLFQAGLSQSARDALQRHLEPLLRGRSEVDALNLLLRFVQTGFPYKTDQEQFGDERFLFPEETIQSAYSDCEDRAILFAYLVREFLGLQTVALHYPRHVTTAVHLEQTDPADVGGHQVDVDGATYVMADPTYINASLGMAMTIVQGLEPEVLSVQ